MAQEMNQYVPDYHQVDYDSIPSSSGVYHCNEKNQNQNHIHDDNNHINFNNNEQGLMEMLWSNGQVVERSLRSQQQLGAPNLEQTARMCSTSASAFPASEPQQQLFMQEDEMASWLHYPIEDDDSFGGTDLVYPAPPLSAPAADFEVRGAGTAVDQIGEARPPVSPLRMGAELELSSNFSFFHPLARMSSRGREPPAAAEANGIGRLGQRVESDSGDLNSVARNARVAHPEAEQESFFHPLARRGREPPAAEANGIGRLGLGVESDGGDLNSVARTVPVAHPEAEQERNRDRDRETYSFDITAMTASSATAEKKENNKNTAEKKENKDTAAEKKENKDLKRKARQEDEDEHQGEEKDDKSEAIGRNKRARGSSSARRSRAAAVHNLSERRRRDRINEKMKALQELIPHCNKSDKASMLDEAIEYLKQLQHQVQLMTMGYNVIPVVLPNGQTYMAPVGVGMGTPIPMQFPHLGGPSLPRPVGPPPPVPRLPIPAYLPPPTSASLGGSRMPPNQPDPLLSHFGVRGLNAMAVPFPAPYQHYLGHYGLQPQPFPPPQARAPGEASTSRGGNGEASTSKAGGGGDQKAEN